MDREDGEMSDDTSMIVDDDVKEPIQYTEDCTVVRVSLRTQSNLDIN